MLLINLYVIFTSNCYSHCRIVFKLKLKSQLYLEYQNRSRYATLTILCSKMLRGCDQLQLIVLKWIFVMWFCIDVLLLDSLRTALQQMLLAFQLFWEFICSVFEGNEFLNNLLVRGENFNFFLVKNLSEIFDFVLKYKDFQFFFC